MVQLQKFGDKFASQKGKNLVSINTKIPSAIKEIAGGEVVSGSNPY